MRRDFIRPRASGLGFAIGNSADQAVEHPADFFGSRQLSFERFAFDILQVAADKQLRLEL